MGNARVISMSSRPLYVSYLCFETGGILDTRHAELGDAVNDIPYQKLCDHLKAFPTIASDPSRLLLDSNGITGLVNTYALATLRNEDRKAALDTSVNSRQNLYFSKYANSAAVISTIRANYSRTSPASKPNLLNILNDIAQQQAMDLQDAYMEDERTGVVKGTSSITDTTSTSYGTSRRANKFYQESVGRTVGKGSKLPHYPPIPWEGWYSKVWTHGYESRQFTVQAPTQTALTTGVSFEQSNNDGNASGTQSATHFDYEYRTPYLEARARHMRAHISLMDQKFEQYMFEQNIPHLEQIFKNELASVDNDVYQFQVSLLRSFLISPLPGIVTGIYKNPGDAVDAGEPVIRVEDHKVVHLVANVVHYGPIAIGATATVKTTLGGSANPATTLNGSVVAARGQGSGGRWEVIVTIDNLDGSGNYIVPLNYSFDAEYTEVSIA